MSNKKRGGKAVKRNLIPPFLMLSAGAVSSIIMHFNYYETNKMLVILLAVMVAFYIAGSLFTMMLNIFDKQNQPVEPEIENVVTDSAAADMQERQVEAEG